MKDLHDVTNLVFIYCCFYLLILILMLLFIIIDVVIYYYLINQLKANSYFHWALCVTLITKDNLLPLIYYFNNYEYQTSPKNNLSTNQSISQPTNLSLIIWSSIILHLIIRLLFALLFLPSILNPNLMMVSQHLLLIDPPLLLVTVFILLSFLLRKAFPYLTC